MNQKTLVHLHDGILCSRKKERAPTFCNSIDGTGDHYTKWNKPGSKRQIPAEFFIDLIVNPFIISNMLFSLHVFECFSIFVLWLISSFISLWSEKMIDMISIFLNLMRLIFYANMWSHVQFKRMYILLLWGEMLWG